MSFGPGDKTDRLVKRAQAGDRAAFDDLVRRYRARIYALSLHLTGSRSEADDITQDVFTRAYQQLHTFAGRSEFFTWLVSHRGEPLAQRAARHRAAAHAAGSTIRRVQAAVAVDAYGDPRRAAELRQTYARLVAALDRLSPTLRSTVVLVSLQGLSHDEAAAVLGCPAGTVGLAHPRGAQPAARLARGRRRRRERRGRLLSAHAARAAVVAVTRRRSSACCRG